MEPNSNDSERAYEVKCDADTDFAILPGEEPLAFELLRTKVAEEWAPDGPVEEDLVLTVTKCIWQRYQSFTAARTTAAKYDPDSKAYDEAFALRPFCQVLEIETEEHQIDRSLSDLGGYFEAHLTNRFQKKNFVSTAKWVHALKVEIDTRLMPAAARLGKPPRQVLMYRSSAIVNDELCAREIKFEERNDAVMRRAIDQLQKIRAAKRRITFLEARRSSKAHPRLLGGSL